MSRGFSLIEVVVSIGIFAVTLVALGALIRTVPLARQTHNEDLALSIARNEIESLRAGGYATLPSSGSFTDTHLAALPSGAGSLVVSSYDAKTKQVGVSVSWQESGQTARTVSLTTLITETGGLP